MPRLQLVPIDRHGDHAWHHQCRQKISSPPTPRTPKHDLTRYRTRFDVRTQMPRLSLYQRLKALFP